MWSKVYLRRKGTGEASLPGRESGEGPVLNKWAKQTCQVARASVRPVRRTEKTRTESRRKSLTIKGERAGAMWAQWGGGGGGHVCS